jgi:hypothetical protein
LQDRQKKSRDPERDKGPAADLENDFFHHRHVDEMRDRSGLTPQRSKTIV